MLIDEFMAEPDTLPYPYHDPFDDILRDMSALHTAKGSDYGAVGDPYANVRASEEFGVPAWLGAIIRLNDKITRIKSFTRKGNLVNESLFDSLRDISVYSVIAQLLYLEENPQDDIKGYPEEGPVQLEDAGCEDLFCDDGSCIVCRPAQEMFQERVFAIIPDLSEEALQQLETRVECERLLRNARTRKEAQF